MNRIVLLSTALGLAATVSHAAEPNSVVTNFLESRVMSWSQNPVLIDAIAAQNSETAGFDAGQIDALDQQWRAEVGSPDSELVNRVLANAASDFLREQVAASGGLVTEVFIMDAQGLNVAASAATSDYWQGDEAKFQETYPLGPDAMHVSEIDFDESTQQYQAQVSITLTDPSTGAPVGAMTLGIDAEMLM